MKRLVLLFTLVLVIAAAGATWWFGQRTQTHFESWMQRQSDLTGHPMETVSYERGFHRSTALTRMRFPVATAEETSTVEVVLRNDIHHGPLPLTRSPQGDVVLKPVLALVTTSLDTILKDGEEILEPQTLEKLRQARVFTQVDFDGGGRSSLRLADLSHTFGESTNDATLRLESLVIQNEFSPNLEHISGKLTMPSLALESPKAEIALGGVQGIFRYELALRNLYVGDSLLDIARFSLHAVPDQGEPVIFGLNDLRLATVSRIEGKNLAGLFSLRFATLSTEDGQYGPGEMEMEMRGLDAEALAAFQTDIKALARSSVPTGSEEYQIRMMQSLQTLAGRILAGSPELEIRRASFRADQGELSSTMALSFQGLGPAALQNPLMFLGGTALRAQLTITDSLLVHWLTAGLSSEMRKNLENPSSEAIRDQARAQALDAINQMEQSNFIERRDGEFVSTVIYEQGQIVVNGQPVPLDQFLVPR